MNRPDRIVLKYRKKSKINSLTILCYYTKDSVVMKYNDIIILGSTVNECLLNIEQYLPIGLRYCFLTKLYKL